MSHTTDEWQQSQLIERLPNFFVGVFAVGIVVPPSIHIAMTATSGIFSTLTGRPLLDPELIDRLTWLTLLATAGLSLIALILISRRPHTQPTPRGSHRIGVLAVAAASMWLLSLSWIQVLPDQDVRTAWWGFGSRVALATIAITVALFIYGVNRALTRGQPLLGTLSAAVVIVWFIPLAIQPPWGVFDLYHTRYVVNEVLAPLAGNFALGEFASLYTTLLGVPLLIFKPFQLMGITLPYYGIAVTWLSLLALLTLGLVIVAARWVLPDKWRSLAPILTIPLILISQPDPIGYGGTITAGFSALPGRLLGFVSVALLLVMWLRSPTQARIWLLGLVAGAAAINNFEFGVTGLAVLCVTLVLSRQLTRTSVLSFILGLPIIPILYVVLVYATSGSVNWSYFTIFALGFSDGFGSIAMPIVGTWTAVSATLVLGAVLGSWLLWNRQAALLVPAALATYAGLAGLLHFGYYVGRSSTYGQLQLLILHMTLVLVALVAIAVRSETWRPRTYSLGLLILVCSLPIATLVNVRPPIEEWSRISPIDKGSQLLRSDGELEKVATAVRAAQQQFPNADIGVASEAGNYLHLATGAENLLLTNSPYDAVIAPGLQGPNCSRITAFEGIVIGHFLLEKLSPPFCGLDVESFGDGTYLIRP